MNIVMHCMGMPFNGETIKNKSLGGSETAAYYMARELAARGHRVSLFTTSEAEGEWEGVKYIFSLSGGHLLRIYNATIHAGIRIIDTRHEQADGHMAEGWSPSTGEMGVCAVPAGPGLPDAVTAVANAKMSNSPMLVLGGRSALFESDIGALQDLDQMSLMTPITPRR